MIITISPAQKLTAVFASVAILGLVGCASQPTANPSTKSKSVKSATPNIVMKNGVPSHYQVKSGDTVVKLAKRYDLNWREISAMNRLDSNHTIYIGQWLMLWQPKDVATHPIKKPILAPAPTLKTQVTQSVGQVQTNRVLTPVKPIALQAPSKEVSQPQKTDESISVLQKPSEKEYSSIQQTTIEETPKSTQELPVKTDNNGIPLLMPMGNTPLVGSSAVRHFRYPVGTQNKAVRQFGSLVNGAKSEGMFFAGHDGDMVVASQSGIVIYADGGEKSDKPKAVMIEHLDGYVSTYIHLKDIAVKKGQNVAVGASIGSMQAQAGNLALFEFRMAKDGQYIDPVSVLK